ncbi:MAG: isoleucine--tRNA ligase, partial [Rikenellaceae bacterium]|nr:isoleucine--tRNA ligase [Rikenellaceae bacterium]
YKTQQGFQVNRKAGWDTHGLPVELGVEKKLGIKKDAIGKTISIEEYNRTCREAVMEFTGVWEDLTRKMGYWVNMQDPYITYDNKYIETLWWMLKQLYEKGLLYKGYTIQPYSPAAGTGLSSHELNQPGCYRDVKDTTMVAQFKMVDPKPEMEGWGTPYFIAWTTTPWTLPSNTALCVGPKIDYVAVRTYNGYSGEKMTVVLAKALLYTHFNKKAEGIALEEYKAGDKLIPFEIVGEYKGADLVGMRYEQLIPWVKPVEMVSDKEWQVASEKAFRVIPGDYVTTEDGTGIVHIAPTFGADDAFVARAAGIPALYMINKRGETRPMVDLEGKFYPIEELDEQFVAACVATELYKDYEARYVKNAYDPQFTSAEGKYDEQAASAAETLDVYIAIRLKEQMKAFKIEKHTHNYPHCWRTDKPVLYYPLDSWFIRSTAMKERMMELNTTIQWKPESTGTGRFGKWLENLNDWNLSRSRFWGTPLPIWATEDRSEMLCIGSIEELITEINRSVEAGNMAENPFPNFKVGDMSKENYAVENIDLHRPYVDKIVLTSPSGKKMYREMDLIDVWFDSGAMPYAQRHYPFENKENFTELFPADFVAEGVDQTRGWFFTLHALSTMLFDSVAFKHIISNGLVLDKNGNKMSKRLNNAVDPFEVMRNSGADATRWYMISNSQPWDNLKFDIEGVDEVRRKFFGTLYNTYSFFALYANLGDGFTGREAEIAVEERPEIDRWILSELNTLTNTVTRYLEDYDPTPAARAIQEFVGENLSNWYVRLNRARFWAKGQSDDKLAAFQTLYTCLETVAKLAAPFAPFYADRLFTDLNAVSGRHTESSVHLADFPKCDESLINKELEEMMGIAQQVTSLTLALRRKVSIKVRQPLQKIMIPVLDAKMAAHVEAMKELIKGEVNVKDVELLHDTTGVITKHIKLNFKSFCTRYAKFSKQMAALLNDFTQEQIAAIESAAETTLEVGGQQLTVTPADFIITSEDMPGWQVASEGTLTVALDITITEELRREGVARELVNRIQNIRKESNFSVTDQIRVEIEATEAVRDSLAEWADYIGRQTLAVEVKAAAEPTGEVVVESDLDEAPLKIAVTRIA